MPLQQKQKKLALLYFGGLFFLTLFAFFGRAYIDGLLPAFRDASHFYFPLYNFVADLWRSGTIPLWNPYANLGMPLAANPVSAAFYPGMLIFVVLGRSAFAFTTFIVLHYIVAGYFVWRLARHFRLRRSAALLALLAYCFGGPVLFQYTNPPYLIGAAWLPGILLCALKYARTMRGAWLRGWAICLALTTFGGDIQTTYNAVLLSISYWAFVEYRISANKVSAPNFLRSLCLDSTKVPRGIYRLTSVATTAFIGIVIWAAFSAVQLVPSAELTRQSDRTLRATPRSVYEFIADSLGERKSNKSDNVWRGLLGQEYRGLHGSYIYEFSFEPWRLLELVWPNFSGRLFPTNRRWMAAVVGEDGIWVPSIYMGVATFAFAIWAVLYCSKIAHVRWLTLVALLALLASFGRYGLGYLIQTVYGTSGETGTLSVIGPGFGGLYWLMVLLLPGYVYFRYPAKLLVPFALAFSLLAAHGCDGLFRRPSSSKSFIVILQITRITAKLPLLFLLIALVADDFVSRMLEGGANPIFGPLQSIESAMELIVSLVLLQLILIFLEVLFQFGQNWALARAVIPVSLTALDLVIANRWMIAYVDARLLNQPSCLKSHIDSTTKASPYHNSQMTFERHNRSNYPIRVWRQSYWAPSAWAKTSSPHRLRELATWERQTLYPNFNLLDRIAIAEVQGAVKPRDYQLLLWVAKVQARRRATSATPRLVSQDCKESGFGHEATFFLPLNIDLALVKHVDKLAGTVPVQLGGLPPETQLLQVANPLPRVWCVHEIVVMPERNLGDLFSGWQAVRETFFPNDQPRNLLQQAVISQKWAKIVENSIQLQSSNDAQFATSSTTEATQNHQPWSHCRVIDYAENYVLVEAHFSRPGLLVLCEQYWPGWKAEYTPITPDPVTQTGRHAKKDASQGDQPWLHTPVIRANCVMRAVPLPAGDYLVRLTYKPTSFYVAAWISLCSWVLVAIACAATLLREKERKTLCAISRFGHPSAFGGIAGVPAHRRYRSGLHGR